MSKKLINALRKKYQTPQAALLALGLDAALLNKETDMPTVIKKGPLSRAAVHVGAALIAHVAPMLAKDAKLDLVKLLTSVNRKALLAKDNKTFDQKEVKRIVKMAMDAIDPSMLSPEGTVAMAPPAPVDAAAGKAGPDDAMIAIINALAPQIANEVAEEVPDIIEAEGAGGSDPDMAQKVSEWAASKGMSEDDLAELSTLMSAGTPAAGCEEDDTTGDETPEEKAAREEEEKKTKGANDMVSKTAMDAALKKTAADTTAAVLATQRGIRDAERAVFPYIGEIAVAQDSAAAVYKLAFDAMGVKVEGVDPSAFPAMLALVPKPNEKKPVPTASIAMDATSLATYETMFGADRVTHL